MSDVTDADREKATRLLSEWGTFRAGDGNLSIGKLDDDERRDNIAAALAEEREKARAPFLALAGELWGDADDAHCRTDQGRMYRMADRIHRAADMTTTREETP